MGKLIVVAVWLAAISAWAQIKPANVTTAKIKSALSINAANDPSVIQWLSLAELNAIDVEANAGRLFYCEDCSRSGIVFVGPNGIEQASARAQPIK